MIQEKITEDMKKAMLAKDSVRVTVLRGLMAAFTNELVSKMKKPSEKLTDDEATAVIARAVKQRKDSIEQFTKGNRADLADAEQKEMAIISEYMPEMMSKDEIRVVAERKKAEMGITDKSKAGQLMGAVMKELKGKADGGDVKEVVDKLLT